MERDEKLQLIFDEIESHGKIAISRHSRPDGDAIGSTWGLAQILRATWPEKDIRVANLDDCSYVSFLGCRNDAWDDAFYDGALQIVCDTGTVDRISNKDIGKAEKVIKIDHHIEDNPFGDISWVEDFRSSVCEMVAFFWKRFSDRLVMTAGAATALYTGMVTDSGRFQYKETSPDTLRLAAELLEVGIDTDTVYAHLYSESSQALTYKAQVLKRMRFTSNGVAYVYIPQRMQRRLGLTNEQASNSVGYLAGIQGSLIWLAFIENQDGRTTRVRLRSRFVHCQPLAAKYGGGGHACAAGATVSSRREMKALIADADAILAEFKKNNTGWM